METQRDGFDRMSQLERDRDEWGDIFCYMIRVNTVLEFAKQGGQMGEVKDRWKQNMMGRGAGRGRLSWGWTLSALSACYHEGKAYEVASYIGNWFRTGCCLGFINIIYITLGCEGRDIIRVVSGVPGYPVTLLMLPVMGLEKQWQYRCGMWWVWISSDNITSVSDGTE